MTMTGDTVEHINVLFGAFWNDKLQPELTDVIKDKVPEPRYKPDETRIEVSTSKRAQRDYQKRFSALAIDSTVVENKLRSWSNEEHTLTVELCFVFKEIEPDTTNKVGKTGRGATKRQLAA